MSKVDMDFQIWGAPMEGVMHPVVIMAMNRLQLTNRWMTPFVRLTSAVPKTPKLRAFLKPFGETGLPVTVQLMGINPHLIADCAKAFAQLGVAGININSACPAGKVVSNQAGGAMLKSPERVLETLELVKQAVPDLPVSVKLRSGFEECDFSWYSELDALELSAVFLHYRTVKELYRKMDFSIALERFAQAKGGLKNTPLIGNGDIVSLTQFQELRKLGLAGVMVGRGWFKEPFLLQSWQENSPIKLAGEEGKKALFEMAITVAKEDRKLPFSNGKAIELANLIWGGSNSVLTKLRSAKKTAWMNLTELN